VITKVRQAAKLTALREALIKAGFRSLDAQSAALGLGRSTTWTILSGKHKSTGLSAATISRILATPHLPLKVRAIVIEYVEERLAGLYGHNSGRLKAFSERIAGSARGPDVCERADRSWVSSCRTQVCASPLPRVDGVGIAKKQCNGSF
jgi:hypothetical protein